MTPPTTRVHSPAGIRLVSGLLAPFLTEEGQDELARRWGADAPTLFAQSVRLTETVTAHQALHAALGVWVRNHAFPHEARMRLGEYLKTLPSDVQAAQQVLDDWANQHTHQMIPTFPCQVTEDTHAVLASAVAVEDTWAREAKETTFAFTGKAASGFRAPTTPGNARSTTDGSAVRVVLPLTSGLEMAFCISTKGLDQAVRLIEQPEMFGVTVEAGQPFVTTRKTKTQTNDVSVVLPVFTTRSTVDIAADPAAWGLAAAMKPFGVPGLGDLEVTDAKQDAFIEVTHTGVRAAAVTAVMMMRSAAMWHREEFTQPLVTFNGPFAYAITHPGFPVALFTGTYAG